jgi:predicted nucleic acid-binding protein
VGFIGKLICVSALWLPILSAQNVARHKAKASFEQKTDKLVDRFNTGGRTLVDSVILLAYEYQVPMAIEYADREATTKPINLEFRNKSLREMLEVIVKRDQQYRVSFSDGVIYSHLEPAKIARIYSTKFSKTFQ